MELNIERLKTDMKWLLENPVEVTPESTWADVPEEYMRKWILELENVAVQLIFFKEKIRSFALTNETTTCYIRVVGISDDCLQNKEYKFDVYGNEMIPYTHFDVSDVENHKFEVRSIIMLIADTLAELTNRKYVLHYEGEPVYTTGEFDDDEEESPEEVTIIYDYITDDETCYGIRERFPDMHLAMKRIEELKASPDYTNIEIEEQVDTTIVCED